MRDERAQSYRRSMTFSRTGSAGPIPSRRPSDQPCDPKTAALPPVQDVVGERLRAVYSQILRDDPATLCRASRSPGRWDRGPRVSVVIEPAVRDAMYAALPHLRAFAISLAGSL